MNFVVEGLPYIVGSVALLYYSVLRFGILPFPTAIIAIMLLSKVVFTSVAAELYVYEFYEFYSKGALPEFYHHTMALYSILECGFVLSMTGIQVDLKSIFARRVGSLIPPSLSALPHELPPDHVRYRAPSGNLPPKFMARVSAQRSQANRAMQRHFRMRRQLQPIAIASCILYIIFVCIQLISVHPDYFWFHQLYLAYEPRISVLNALGPDVVLLTFRANQVMVFIGAVAISFSLFVGKPGLASLAGMAAVGHMLFLLGEASRVATILPAGTALMCLILRVRDWKVYVFVGFGVALYALLHSLVGRSSGSLGIVGIATTASTIFGSVDGINWFLRLAANVCEGIFVIAEGYLIDLDYAPIYSWTAISPLPSFIDGYSSIFPNEQLRIHVFVPTSSLTELRGFGFLHITVVSLIMLTIVRLHGRISQNNVFVFLIVNGLLFISIYVSFTYPVRNALRFVWSAYFILGIFFLITLFRSSARNEGYGPTHNSYSDYRSD